MLFLKKIKAENVAGIVSIVGSVIVSLKFDPTSFIAISFIYTPENIVGTALFTAAEITFARYGHKRAGYSIGAGFLCIGDIAVALSPALSHSHDLQRALFCMAAIWSIAACRALITLLADHLNNDAAKKNFYRVADVFIPPLVGISIIIMRIPGIISACAVDNYFVAVGIALLGISDILAGRLHEILSKARRYIENKLANI